MLGSAYKRLARIQTDRKSMTEALTQAATYYKEAADVGGKFDPYHALNWITLEALLGHKLPDAESCLARCEAAAVERYAAAHKLWDAVALPDADVARRLLRGELKADAVETIVARYREVFCTAQATPREQDSVLGQLRFIKEMSRWPGGDGATVDTITAILKGLTGEEEPPSTDAVLTPVSKPKGRGGAKGGRKKPG